MKKFPHPVSIPVPSAPTEGLAADNVAFGQPVHPEDRIRIFSDKQWERFVQEWVDSLRDTYKDVERCGGAGDMGRDVIATVKDDAAAWDNYQCKHYATSLTPTDIWIELGKLAYYTKRGDYTYPRRYYFIAPRGAGTKLSNLLKKADELRSELFSNWDRYCREEITSTENVDLDDEMKAYITGLDFSIFSAMPVLRIIEAHAKTRWHVAQFGGGLPSRPDPLVPPDLPTAEESVFVAKLRGAYAEHLKRDLKDVDEGLAGREDLREHFNDARVEFYSAEGLRTFSRDTLPPGEFEKLQDEVHSGIRDDIRGQHDDGYRRIVAVVKTARSLPLTGHSLHSRIHTRDKGGICHQLANDGRIDWTKK